MKKQTIYPFEALKGPEQTESGIRYDSFIAGENEPVLQNRISAACNYYSKKMNCKFGWRASEIDGKMMIKVYRKS